METGNKNRKRYVSYNVSGKLENKKKSLKSKEGKILLRKNWVMTAISYRNARCVSAQRCLRRERCWRGRRCSSCSLQNGTSFLFSRTVAELWLRRRAPCSSLLTFTHTIREKNKLKTHKNQGSTAGCGHFRLARTAKCGNTEEKMEFCSGLQRDNWILCRSFV